MALYECTFIARPDLSPQDAQKMIEDFSAIVVAQGGKVEKTEYWGLRSLAYRINKNRKGHYAFLCIDAPSVAIDELRRQLGLNEDVMRQLIVVVEAFSKELSVLHPQREVKNEREEGGRPSRGDREGYAPRGRAA